VHAGETEGRPPRPELEELAQITLTPHISGSGDTATVELVRGLFAANLRRFLDGQPLVNEVDRVRGY
jgi:phosphoglycerate dehydrogenase-like enzyme